MKLLEACRARPRTLVVLDWPNLRWWTLKRKLQLEIIELYDFLRDTLGPDALIAALTRHNPEDDPTKGESRDRQLLAWAGFTVLQIYRPRGKSADVDAQLSMLVTWQLANNPNLEHVVIGSGDGDFTPLIHLAKLAEEERGKPITVSVFAFDESISTQLREAADATHDIASIPGLVTQRAPREVHDAERST